VNTEQNLKVGLYIGSLRRHDSCVRSGGTHSAAEWLFLDPVEAAASEQEPAEVFRAQLGVQDVAVHRAVDGHAVWIDSV
jgi:hypothetical protein